MELPYNSTSTPFLKKFFFNTVLLDKVLEGPIDTKITPSRKNDAEITYIKEYPRELAFTKERKGNKKMTLKSLI